MKNFLKQQREIIAIIIYLFILSGFVYFILKPLINAIISVRDEIQKETLTQEYKKNSLVGLPKMENQYQFLRENTESVNILLDENRAVILIERLEKVAESTGNKITIAIIDNKTPAVTAKLATSASKKVDAPKTIVSSLPSNEYLQMKISLSGSYNSIVDFITSLQKLEYYCDTIGIQIHQKKEDAEQATQFQDSSFNPFSESVQLVGAIGVNKQVNLGNVDAILDVVFYTKK